MTEKLYNSDSYIKEFDATVLSCTENAGKYEVILDKTAFFPEGGGQSYDEGTINGTEVLNVKNRGDYVIHVLPSPIKEGTCVHGIIDWQKRFSRMQNHSGEHVISGIVHKLYGYDNVGFHLGDDCVTLDFNGSLDEKQLEALELSANEAVFSDVKISVLYPDDGELEKIKYRSKLSLTHGVRLVKIEGYDLCACCAPHVSSTGQIGIIKFTDTMKYKGGVRITIACGYRALYDYRDKLRDCANISNQLSVPRDKTPDGVSELKAEYNKEKEKTEGAVRKYLDLIISGIQPTGRSVCIVENGLSQLQIRYAANEAVTKTDKLCGVFSGNDENGYIYVISSKNIRLKALAQSFASSLGGKCGGSDLMLFGASNKTKAEIVSYFENVSL